MDQILIFFSVLSANWSVMAMFCFMGLAIIKQ